MALLIELKYFNTFWLKKIKAITDVVPGLSAAISGWSESTKTMTLNALWPTSRVNVGMQTTVKWDVLGTTYTWRSSVVSLINGAVTQIVLKDLPPIPFTNSPQQNVVFGKIIDFENIPQGYPGASDADDDWLLEESRIRGGYNNTSVD